MDKGSMPVRRNRKPLNLFRNQSIDTPRKPKETKSRRRDSKKQGNWLSRGLKTILYWFGWGRSAHRNTCGKNYPRWMEKRIARNRRRRKLGNISRRQNR